MTEVLSIDHLILEQCRDEGGEYFIITRFGREGEKMPEVRFKKGDRDAAYKFLDTQAELFGVK